VFLDLASINLSNQRRFVEQSERRFTTNDRLPFAITLCVLTTFCFLVAVPTSLENVVRYRAKETKFKIAAPFHPASPFISCWDFVSGVLLLYTCVVTPMLIAFFSEVEGFCELSPTIEFDLFVDAFFLAEIGVNFLTAVDGLDSYISSLRILAGRYINGQFFVDVISSCPIAWVEFFLSPNMTCEELAISGRDQGIIRYFRFVRVIRLLRFVKVLKIFTVLRNVFKFSPTTISLMKCAFFVCILAHLGGCLWWFVKTAINDQETLELFKEAENIRTPILSTYIVAVYFLMCTLCTVGYGDISAGSDGERILVTLIMLIGASVFAVIISNMSSIVATMQAKSSANEEQVMDILHFLRQHRCSSKLQYRIQNYFEYKAESGDFTDKLENVVDDIPAYLSDQINLSILWPVLASSPAFDGISRHCALQLSRHMEPMTFLPAERVFSSGDESSSLFLILSGEVQLLLPNPIKYNEELLLMKHYKGSVVGSTGVLMDVFHAGDAWAKGYAQLYELPAMLLRKFLQIYPTLGKHLAADMNVRTKSLRGVLELQDKHWQVVDLLNPPARWLYLSVRLHLIQKAKMEEMKWQIESEGHDWHILVRSELNQTGPADHEGRLGCFEHLQNPSSLTIPEALDLIVQGDCRVTQTKTPKTPPSTMWALNSGKWRDQASETALARQAALEKVSLLRSAQDDMLLATCENASTWQSLAEKAKVLHAGIQLAIGILEANIEPTTLSRPASESSAPEMTMDKLLQSKAVAKVAGKVEEQILSLICRARCLRMGYEVMKESDRKPESHDVASNADSLPEKFDLGWHVYGVIDGLKNEDMNSVSGHGMTDDGVQGDSNYQDIITFRCIGQDKW
jgi:CRP-like cAMP-binding protein